MTRRIRLFIADSVYHVYGRVTRGEHIFEEPTEVESWIDAVAYEARLAEMKILAWCLMSAHFHLVVRTGVTPLWRVMHRTQARTAREHNRRRGVIGEGLRTSDSGMDGPPAAGRLSSCCASEHLTPNP